MSETVPAQVISKPVLEHHIVREVPSCGARRRGVLWLIRELSAGVRKSETVTLRDPVMPVTDGFSG